MDFASMSQEPEQDTGDFANRCLPKTYAFYASRRWAISFRSDGIDKFDFFLRSEVPILQFLNDEFYASGRSSDFALAAICQDTLLLGQLDESIVTYLRSGKSRARSDKIRDNYIILLENAIVRAIRSRKGGNRGEP